MLRNITVLYCFSMENYMIATERTDYITSAHFYLGFFQSLSIFFIPMLCSIGKCNTDPLNWIPEQLMLFLSEIDFHINVSVFIRIAGQMCIRTDVRLRCYRFSSRATIRNNAVWLKMYAKRESSDFSRSITALIQRSELSPSGYSFVSSCSSPSVCVCTCLYSAHHFHYFQRRMYVKSPDTEWITVYRQYLRFYPLSLRNWN